MKTFLTKGSFYYYLKQKTLILFIFYDKIFKKGKGTEMKNKKVPEEIMIDYVAKGRMARTNGNTKLKHVLVGVVATGYTIYSFYPMAMVFTKEIKKENFFGFFLFLIFMVAIPFSAVLAMFPADGIDTKIKAVRKFLLEVGQEATSENINLLLNRYYKGNWQKIEDMLYEYRKVFSTENIELISGNMSNKNLKKALPTK